MSGACVTTIVCVVAPAPVISVRPYVNSLGPCVLMLVVDASSRPLCHHSGSFCHVSGSLCCLARRYCSILTFAVYALRSRKIAVLDVLKGRQIFVLVVLKGQ